MDFHLVIFHQPVGPNQSALRSLEKPNTSTQSKEETQLASSWAWADWLVMLGILSLKAEVIMFPYISEKRPLFFSRNCRSACISYWQSLEQWFSFLAAHEKHPEGFKKKKCPSSNTTADHHRLSEFLSALVTPMHSKGWEPLVHWDAVVLQVWTLGQQHQHHLRTC